LNLEILFKKQTEITSFYWV